MFKQYLKKIIGIPLTEIKVSEDGYRYLITTYTSVINEYGTEKMVENRIKKCKRIKSFDGWYFNKNDLYYKDAIVEFVKK